MPKTRFGNFSLRFFGGFIVCFLVAEFFVMTGQTGGDSFFDNLWLSIPMSLAFFAAILAFVLGFISIFHEGERAPFILIVSSIGGLILIFLLGELLLPH